MSETLSVSDAMGNAGELPQIEWKGRTYQVAHACPSAVQKAEQEVARTAWANVQAMAPVVPADQFAKMQSETLAAIQRGDHGFGKPLYTAAMDGPDGLFLALFGCLRQRNPEVTMADVRAMYRDCRDAVRLALAQVGPEFFARGAETLPATPEEQAAVAESLTKWQAARMAG